MSPQSRVPDWLRQHGFTPRRNAGLAAYENSLARAGLSPVAGIDEAGRGACAGPLVVAAVVLDSRSLRKLPGLADSKLLTERAREEMYPDILHRALDWHAVVIPEGEIDAVGLHVCNIQGMRRALAGLRIMPGYALTDGFPVPGLGVPALAVWKGDRVAASVAAASIVAKVTRDRMMRELGERYPVYGFSRHKGYVTDEHLRALREHGPSPVHRRSFRCVPAAGAAGLADIPGEPVLVAGEETTGRDWVTLAGPAEGE
jgi:ribonuclease HII